MRFERVARKLWCEPWLILPRMHKVISGVFENHLKIRQQQPGVEDLFDKVEEPEMEAMEGVAIIPIKGVISREISDMERISGACDVNDVAEMIDEAESDINILAVVFDVDSPGGGVEGVEELADKIYGMKKPCIAQTSGMSASAAYWLSSAADMIYATASSTVGSIGVYLPVLDESRAYEQVGLYVDLIKSKKTPYKGAGYPGTSLTEEQRNDFQAGVDYLYERFSGAVKKYRKQASADAMDGRTFFGSQAIEYGLIDAVASFEQAVNDARKMAKIKTSLPAAR